MKRLLIIIALLACSLSVWAQKYTLSGVVLDKNTKQPVEFATVLILDKEIWSVADEKGEFVLRNIPAGTLKIEVSCLCYKTLVYDIKVTKDVTNFKFYVEEDNLTLADAVITAKESTSNATTSRTIDKVALEHLQINNVTDISSLLPGGATPVTSNLTGENYFAIRSSNESLDNSAFGTAVEIDGVRLSSNSSHATSGGVPKGISTRNIASTNIESVEVITGVPSVEYGDMTNGMVKINTRQGKTPLMVNAMTNPNTKQIAISKGIELGKKAGIFNISAERTRAISRLDSPFTSYERNNLSLIYSNTLGLKSSTPLKIKVGVTGNLGGMDSKADPDSFKDTYTKTNDNTIRGNFDLNWLLNKSWITNIEFTGSAIYSDKFSTTKTNKSAASSTAAIHGKQEGYYVAETFNPSNPDAEIILIPAGYWYEIQNVDSREINYSLHLKANWSHNFGSVSNKIKAGINYTGSGNLGEGIFYEDISLAPSWRSYPYNEIPFMNNIAVYLEDNVNIPIGKTNLNLIGGVRSEWTQIKGSDYGTVNSISPRFNGKWSIIKNNRKHFVRELSVRGSWGIAVKLPSFGVLFPDPSYQDKLVFAPGTLADGSSFSAYHTIPKSLVYNPNLVWQQNHQSEVGVETNLGGVKVSLTGYYNKTYNSYTTQDEFIPYSYKWTDQADLEKCTIPSANRSYAIDRNTGVVTVHDKTGVIPSQMLTWTDKNTFKGSTTTANNPSPSTRAGVEWIIDFGTIKSLMTSIRLDGNYYYFHGVNSIITGAYNSTVRMPDGVTPLQYVAYYVGGDQSSNGNMSKQVRTNLTFTTHIPKIRMIVSLKIESSLYKTTQTLSEYEGGQVTYPISEEIGKDLPIGTEFYGKLGRTATYPLYYVTYDNPNEKIPFLEKYAWAQKNDPSLYSLLSRLVTKSNYNYIWKSQGISPYFSANISVTKEIGDIASISFYANNFINTMSKVYQERTDTYSSLYNLGYVPKFYYGLSLRLKF